MSVKNDRAQAERVRRTAKASAERRAGARVARHLGGVALLLAALGAQAAEGADEAAVPTYRFTVSSTWMTVTNPLPNSASMYEVHFGYRLTPRDTLAVKACSWKLFEPMGIPLWDPHLQQKSEFYPGRIHEFGVGVAYQRLLWRGLFASVQVVPLKKRYLDERGRAVGDGFKLYTSYHLGFRVTFLRERLYVEPQVHINYWPVDSRGPAAFEEREARWPNDYFLFEPNLFLGVNL